MDFSFWCLEGVVFPFSLLFNHAHLAPGGYEENCDYGRGFMLDEIEYGQASERSVRT